MLAGLDPGSGAGVTLCWKLVIVAMFDAPWNAPVWRAAEATVTVAVPDS